MHAGISRAAKSNLSSNGNTRTAYNLSRSITSQSHSWQRDFSLFSLARSPFGLTREKLLRQILLRPRGIAFVCNSKMIPPGRDADWRSHVNSAGEDEKSFANNFMPVGGKSCANERWERGASRSRASGGHVGCYLCKRRKLTGADCFS